MPNEEKEPEKEVEKLIKEVEEIQKPAVKTTYSFYMFYPRFKANIERDDVLSVINELSKIKTSKEESRIDLILSSGGGNPHAAYQIIKIIRSKCSELNIVVPLFAKSAATLMALGGDRIYMGPQSELGPLDLPMEHPTEEQIRISALDGVRPVDYFTGVSARLIKKLYGYYRNEEGLARKTAVELAQKFASDYITPITSRLDPIIVNMCYRELEVAEDYGNELLKDYMLNNNTDKENKASDIMTKLVWGYKSHSYVICYHEALRIGLTVLEDTKYNNWTGMWNRFLSHKQEDKKIILIESEKR